MSPLSTFIKSTLAFWNAMRYLPGLLMILSLLILPLAQANEYEGCLKKSDDPILASAIALSRLSKMEVQTAARIIGGYQRFSSYLKYAFQVYKIEYTTPFEGKTVLASGLVCIPEGASADTPILVAQNGTIMAHKKAPSSFKPPTRFNGLTLFAATGYITFIPDYIGFGSSENLTHPYYNYQYTTTTVINMIKAGRQFLLSQKIDHSSNLFLFGYSKGGYSAMATHKAIEEDPSLDFTVKATATGAGSYDLKRVMEQVVNEDVFPAPSFLAFLMYSYNQLNHWQRDLADFFQEPYATDIPQLLDGKHKKKRIDQQLTEVVEELFAPQLLQGLRDQTEMLIIEALERNSVHNWMPQAPLRIYHSPNDEIIPYSSSVATFETIRDLGATDLALIPTEGESHAKAVFYMIEKVLPWFESLR